MHLFTSPKPQFPLCSSYSYPNPKPLSKISISTFSSLPLTNQLTPPLARNSAASPPPPLQEQVLISDSDDEADEGGDEGSRSVSRVEDKLERDSGSDGILAVRRPVKVEDDSRPSDDGDDDGVNEEEKEGLGATSRIDKGLSDIAKKMPIFEPAERVANAPEERPLGINLELALYRAKVLSRGFQFKEAEKLLRKCIIYWPEDGRPYVALGKILIKQSRHAEARSVYERGCQATEGENSYIWQCWAVLESKVGNLRRARELFDAATVADKRHVAAWHGWAVLEIKQGNIKKARSLLGKGLKYCGGNEFIYQTLALLEAKGSRFEQARYLFQQATKCNPKSCASWLAWAQVEMQQENNEVARQLFQKAVQASPKNRFAWHVWGLFEANQGNIDKGRKLLKIGHALNPRDPVLLQTLALLEYKHSSANLARLLFRKASEQDPRHQPVWIAWGWMEWKEGNLSTARELYQRALSIDSTTESAARCLQAWGVLEQRVGNLSAARRLFRSSLNINSQSYVTWMTWASVEEEQGNTVRAEEIRNLYFQQRTEVVDDASWVMGFLDILDPALDSIKKLLRLDESSDPKSKDRFQSMKQLSGLNESLVSSSSLSFDSFGSESKGASTNDFALDTFIKEKLSLDASKLDEQMDLTEQKKNKYPKKIFRAERRTVMLQSPI